MRRLARSLTTMAVVSTLAVAGSLVARAIWDGVTAEEPGDARPPSLATLGNEAAQERFEGEILRVFIGPPGAAAPDKFTTHEDVCESKPTEQVSWSEAGDLDINFTLPESFKLQTGSLNTGVIACGDTVYAARWEFSFAQSNGYPGSLIVSRGILDAAEFDASADRVEAASFGGLDAVYIVPLSPNGVGSAAGVIFPGASVTTIIISSGVPEPDLLKAAESVASGLKEGGAD
jgi:hypothetical protein